GPHTVHLSWIDSTHGNASYLLTDDATIRFAGRVASFDWTGLPEDKIICFKISSGLNGYTTPWSAAVCATTPRSGPWCPSADETHPGCDATGAFQVSCPDVSLHCTSSVDDFGISSPIDADLVTMAEAEAALAYMLDQGWDHAAAFLSH